MTLNVLVTAQTLLSISCHPPEVEQTYAKVVKSLRQREHITQEELADRLGVSRAYVANVESGRVKNPARFLRRLAIEFNLAEGSVGLPIPERGPLAPLTIIPSYESVPLVASPGFPWAHELPKSIDGLLETGISGVAGEAFAQISSFLVRAQCFAAEVADDYYLPYFLPGDYLLFDLAQRAPGTVVYAVDRDPNGGFSTLLELNFAHRVVLSELGRKEDLDPSRFMLLGSLYGVERKRADGIVVLSLAPRFFTKSQLVELFGTESE